MAAARKVNESFLFIVIIRFVPEWELLLGNDGKEGERLGGGGIDKAVGMALGAVVALARSQFLLAVVVQHAGLAAEDVYHLAAGVVAVVADGAARVETAAHYLVCAVVEHLCLGHSFAAL